MCPPFRLANNQEQCLFRVTQLLDVKHYKMVTTT
jgi:hypothetical protein